MSDLHTWAVWERKYDRRGRAFTELTWKLISHHKTRVAADLAAKRGFNRIVRRASHGKPS